MIRIESTGVADVWNDTLTVKMQRIIERRGDREETEIMEITRTHSIDRRKIR